MDRQSRQSPMHHFPTATQRPKMSNPLCPRHAGPSAIHEPSTSGLAALRRHFGGGSMATPMIGDFIGTPISIPSPGMTVPTPHWRGSATFSNPFLARTFKVVEGQSPVPQNRVYGRYNLFNRLDNNNANLNRYVIGFERTFFDGNASFGMLLPFYSINQGLFAQPAGADPVGPLGFGSNSGSAGDLTIDFQVCPLSESLQWQRPQRRLDGDRTRPDPIRSPAFVPLS